MSLAEASWRFRQQEKLATPSKSKTKGHNVINQSKALIIQTFKQILLLQTFKKTLILMIQPNFLVQRKLLLLGNIKPLMRILVQFMIILMLGVLLVIQITKVSSIKRIPSQWSNQKGQRCQEPRQIHSELCSSIV
jgi:hypothetical protein